MKKTLIGISLLLMVLALGCPEPTIFTVTFDSQGGSEVANASVTELEEGMGALVAKPTPDPTKKDATFLGWYKETEGTTAWNFASDLVKANITLFAKWDNWETVASPSIVTTGAMDWSTGNKFVALDVPSGATAYYTTGSDDFSLSAWTEYENTAFVVNLKDSSVTVRAIATQDGMVNSAIASHEFEKANVVSAPSIVITGVWDGITGDKSITLEVPDGATAYYTTGAADFSPSTWTEYENTAFIVNIKDSSVTVRAIATQDGMVNSLIATRKFEKAVTLSAPTITHEEGLLIQNSSKFTLATTTEGAEIRYTTNGDEPIATSSLYTAPFTLGEEGEKTIKAIAIKDGMINSNVAMATLTVLNESYKHTSVFVEGETFSMGAEDIATPVHSVTLSDFYMGKYEVTQKEYSEVMEFDPCAFTEYGKGDNNPVHYITWYRAIAYCNKLSISEKLDEVYTVSGVNFATLEHSAIPTSNNDAWNAAICDWEANGYRLPTEAEWEYAAKGGIHKEDFIYSGSNNIDEVAWHGGNSGNVTNTVGTQAANKLGLYDMSGNIQEWCWDWYSKTYYDPEVNPDNGTNPKGPVSSWNRVIRGGSFGGNASRVRVAYRNAGIPYDLYIYYGFRLVRSAP